jgi:hypothetical protein
MVVEVPAGVPVVLERMHVEVLLGEAVATAEVVVGQVVIQVWVVLGLLQVLVVVARAVAVAVAAITPHLVYIMVVVVLDCLDWAVMVLAAHPILRGSAQVAVADQEGYRLLVLSLVHLVAGEAALVAVAVAVAG